MIHRTTFALDDTTVKRLKRLSKLWDVSQAEVVRRAVELAEQESEKSRSDPLESLRTYHASGGLEARTAVSCLKDVAENRKEWGRGT